MAYVNDEEELKQGGAGGQVLAGSGGASSGSKQATGTGFTNLQTYLSANKGQGGGIADAIIGQGQQAVDAAKTNADNQTNAWADSATTQINQSTNDAVNPYNTATNALQANPYADYTNPYNSTYGGPQTAKDVDGYNDLEKAYQNVKNTASNFQGDRMTQQAGLQKNFGYGSGFAALDGFLGRQDGADKINSWAAGVQPGSAQGAIDKVNNSITAGKQQVTDSQKAFEQANTQAENQRSKDYNSQKPMIDPKNTGIAGRVDIWDPLKDTISGNNNSKVSRVSQRSNT